MAPHVPAVATLPPLRALEEALGHGTPAIVAGSLYLAGEIRHEIL